MEHSEGEAGREDFREAPVTKIVFQGHITPPDGISFCRRVSSHRVTRLRHQAGRVRSSPHWGLSRVSPFLIRVRSSPKPREITQPVDFHTGAPHALRPNPATPGKQLPEQDDFHTGVPSCSREMFSRHHLGPPSSPSVCSVIFSPRTGGRGVPPLAGLWRATTKCMHDSHTAHARCTHSACMMHT